MKLQSVVSTFRPEDLTKNMLHIIEKIDRQTEKRINWTMIVLLALKTLFAILLVVSAQLDFLQLLQLKRGSKLSLLY